MCTHGECHGNSLIVENAREGGNTRLCEQSRCQVGTTERQVQQWRIVSGRGLRTPFPPPPHTRASSAPLSRSGVEGYGEWWHSDPCSSFHTVSQFFLAFGLAV